MNTKQLPALLALSREVPWALSPELCAPRWGSQPSPPPSAGLHAHGNLQPPRIPDGEPPVWAGHHPSPSSLLEVSHAVCPLSSPLAVPRFLQAPISLLSCLDRCRDCIKTLFSPTWGLRGHLPAPIRALLGMMCRNRGGGGRRLLCLPSPGVTVGLFLVIPSTVGAPTPDTHPGSAEPPAANPRRPFAPARLQSRFPRGALPGARGGA